MAGVNRAAVAVTDTFDVWRVRTNELNTSLNAGTHAKTADTIVWRDDDASFVANVVTANTLTMALTDGKVGIGTNDPIGTNVSNEGTAAKLFIFISIELELSNINFTHLIILLI